ncbi:MAG: SAM-dependent methyltransferase [Verrucomicrobiota bacterium]|nr:SAM-dependent methyltransferase [Verrucomicrobiota bacterium]
MEGEHYDLNNGLTQLIVDEIRQSGPITFARFMSLALYHPEHGYYERDQHIVGKTGDFFTNVSVGPAFGRMISVSAHQYFQKKVANHWFVVEQGAHTGDFARDFLNALPEVHSGPCTYILLEPSSVRKHRQYQNLKAYVGEGPVQVKWVDSWEEVSGIVGPAPTFVFMNELLDALPVHLLITTQTGWMEKKVGVNGEGFTFVYTPLPDDLKCAVQDWPQALAEGFETEICPAVSDLVESINGALQKCSVLIADYGFTEEEMFQPERQCGSLACYRSHQVNHDPFLHIGTQDITCHVNWTYLSRCARQARFKVSSIQDQYHYLTRIIEQMLSLNMNLTPDFLRQFKTLTHGSMGIKFKYIVLTK